MKTKIIHYLAVMFFSVALITPLSISAVIASPSQNSAQIPFELYVYPDVINATGDESVNPAFAVHALGDFSGNITISLSGQLPPGATIEVGSINDGSGQLNDYNQLYDAGSLTISRFNNLCQNCLPLGVLKWNFIQPTILFNAIEQGKSYTVNVTASNGSYNTTKSFTINGTPVQPNSYYAFGIPHIDDYWEKEISAGQTTSLHMAVNTNYTGSINLSALTPPEKSISASFSANPINVAPGNNYGQDNPYYFNVKTTAETPNGFYYLIPQNSQPNRPEAKFGFRIKVNNKSSINTSAPIISSQPAKQPTPTQEKLKEQIIPANAPINQNIQKETAAQILWQKPLEQIQPNTREDFATNLLVKSAIDENYRQPLPEITEKIPFKITNKYSGNIKLGENSGCSFKSTLNNYILKKLAQIINWPIANQALAQSGCQSINSTEVTLGIRNILADLSLNNPDLFNQLYDNLSNNDYQSFIKALYKNYDSFSADRQRDIQKIFGIKSGKPQAASIQSIAQGLSSIDLQGVKDYADKLKQELEKSNQQTMDSRQIRSLAIERLGQKIKDNKICIAADKLIDAHIDPQRKKELEKVSTIVDRSLNDIGSGKFLCCAGIESGYNWVISAGSETRMASQSIGNENANTIVDDTVIGAASCNQQVGETRKEYAYGSSAAQNASTQIKQQITKAKELYAEKLKQGLALAEQTYTAVLEEQGKTKVASGKTTAPIISGKNVSDETTTQLSISRAAYDNTATAEKLAAQFNTKDIVSDNNISTIFNEDGAATASLLYSPIAVSSSVLNNFKDELLTQFPFIKNIYAESEENYLTKTNYIQIISNNSNAAILITDPLARNIGYNPLLQDNINQIKGARYERLSEESSLIFIPGVSFGNYDIRLIGLKDGNYDIDATLAIADKNYNQKFTGEIKQGEIINGSTQTDFQATSTLNFSEKIKKFLSKPLNILFSLIILIILLVIGWKITRHIKKS